MPRSKLKYLLALLFGLSLLGPYFTNFICFKQAQLTHRKSIKKRFNASLNPEEFETLVFSHKEFAALNWDGDDEFYLGPKKYDLFKVELHGDSLTVWAWWDHAESSLEKRFHQMLHRSKNQPLKGKPSLSLDKLSKYLAQQNTHLASLASADAIIYLSLEEEPIKPFLSINSPPPLLF